MRPTFYGSTWKSRVKSVTESQGWNPEVQLELEAWRTDHDDPPEQERLPRAGGIYWLISDYVFQQLLEQQEAAFQA